MCPNLVEIRLVTSEIRHRKKRRKKEKTTAMPFGIAIPYSVITMQYAGKIHLQLFGFKRLVTGK